MAAQEGHLEIVRLLLDNGADPYLMTSNFRSALDIATSKGHAEVVNIVAAKMQQLRHNQTFLKRAVVKPPSAAPNRAAGEMEEMLCCPITLEIMKDPVVAGDGHTYERKAIVEWIRSHGNSPMTQQPLSALALVPNLNLKHQIDVYHRTKN